MTLWPIDCAPDFKGQINHEFSAWGFFSAEELDDLELIPEVRQAARAAMALCSQRFIAKELSRYNLGLIRSSVRLHDHQADWRKAYCWVAAQVEAVLGASSSAYQFEHFDATGVTVIWWLSPSSVLCSLRLMLSSLSVISPAS